MGYIGHNALKVYISMRRLLIRADATRYVLIMALSFATSVVVTRWYLELTGYPQLGNATFHIAHALWGGLLQLVAALLIFIFINRWVRDVSAALAGVGVGLFIDEVGKFITQKNDYFFPLAAPIIYVVFLLTLLIYLAVKRRQVAVDDFRVDMYQVLSELEEVLEADLSVSERDLMIGRLHHISQQTTRPDLAALAHHISTFLQSKVVVVFPDKPSHLKRFLDSIKHLEDRFLSRQRTRYLLIALFLLNVSSTLFMLSVLVGAVYGSKQGVPSLIEAIVLDQSTVDSATSLSWYLIMITLDGITGLLLAVSAMAFLVKRDRVAVGMGVMGLVVTLTFINTLSFYYNQFSVVVSSIFVFLVLLLLQRYRDRFMQTTASLI